MKRSSTLLLAGLTGYGMLLAGCSTVSPAQSALLQAASDRYAKVTLYMSREELLRTLGPPQQDGAHLLMWKVQSNPNDFVMLGVELDYANVVAAIARTHSWFVEEPFQNVGIEPLRATREANQLALASHWRANAELLIRPGYRPTEIQGLPGFPSGLYAAIALHASYWRQRSH